MKNLFKTERFAIFSADQKTGSQPLAFRLFAILALAVAAAIVPHLVSRAQTREVPSKVWTVAAQPSGSGTVVSIAADAPLVSGQNWQDSEGYHLVLPNTVSGESLRAVKGVKVRRVGSSLEVLLQTKPGSTVSVQAEGNELSLLVDKKLDARSEAESQARTDTLEPQQFESSTQTRQVRNDIPPVRFSTPVEDLGSHSPSLSSSGETAHTARNWSAPMGPVADAPAPQQSAPGDSSAAAPEADPSQVEIQPEDEGLVASIFSGTSVFVVIALGLFGLLVTRKLRSRQALAFATQPDLSAEAEWVEDEIASGTSMQVRQSPGEVANTSLVRSAAAGQNGSSRQSVARIPVSGPTTLFGAYRIDQEVGKLVLGQPHRMDVLASRAIDDRRAIETSLIKSVNAPDLDEGERRRAREALEEYGFVARQCATLLLAPDAFERTSAARCLGEVKSEAALPFLLEGLYDSESIVRNQAVMSIGELKMPSAIGALLDIARTHPDVPSALLSRTLSACSVEGLDFFDAMPVEPAQLGMGHDLSVIEQITHLEPSSAVDELSADSEDEQLVSALTLVKSSDVQDRAEALKVLAQFRVQSSLAAIALVARGDSEPNIRAAAVSTLGLLDHESVFPAILIGMADDSREVRASAARSLNRLSFDRADAYARVIETSDEQTIIDVAKACIQAGIVSQNLDRLASSDRRQAYETFSLICLLAKANVYDPILDAIAGHPSMDVRLKAVHLLACTAQADTFERLRQLAVRDGVSEEVKTALLEGMYRLDQEAKRKETETVAAVEANDTCEPQFETNAVENSADDSVQEFEFSFSPSPEQVTQLEDHGHSGFEVQANPDELEM
jgi:HEAT repeat protein